MNVPRWPRADEQWYLGVRCRKCRAPILFALDRSEGERAGQPASARKLVLTCTLEACGHQADYSTAAISRFRKQQAVPVEKADERVKVQKRKSR